MCFVTDGMEKEAIELTDKKEERQDGRGLLFYCCKCPIILPSRNTTRVLETPSFGVLYQGCKCYIFSPYRDTTRVFDTPSIGVLY